MIECDFFNRVSRKKFLERYWRRRPLLIKGGVRGLDSILNRKSIFQLAAQRDSISRLISRGSGSKSWDLKFGPFKQSQLTAMPKDNWTVLVQEIDHKMPELEKVRAHFQVTPQWLFDDIMVSYAAKNGSVGPHYDQYDVFLIQGFGLRRWQIGDVCDLSTELLEDVPLKIIKQFRPTMEWLCEPGDVLYLPPMIPHYGVAVSDCSTFSVGFRSVSSRELFEAFIDRVAPLVDETTIKFQPDDQSAGRAEIRSRDYRRLKDSLLGVILAPGSIEGVIGTALTAQRRQGDGISSAIVPGRFRGGRFARILPHARLAYVKSGKSGLRFFAEGMEFTFSKKVHSIVAALFDRRIIDFTTISPSSLKVLRRELQPLLIANIVALSGR